MFIKMSYFLKKVRDMSIKIFNTIENNNNPDFETNGEKVFIDRLFKLFQKIEGKKIIFDIGANIGNYSMMIKNKSLETNIKIELHLFEPTKSCFEELTKKFGSEKSIWLNKLGVSNTNNSSYIFYDKEKSGLASLYKRNLKNYHLELNIKEKVQLIRLDKYIKKRFITHINFIKIDTEGNELKILKSLGKFMNANFIDFIQFEYGGASLDSHISLMEIYQFLANRKFKIAKIMPKGLEIRDYKPFMENFQYSNYVAISMPILKILKNTAIF